ncbi:decapping and exoribonuclease protein-like [Linepithema humile]|uniref:decapping and exoribonuclease protein-like n=1 Tax=Linepithema humile TaxID=83485 RepID=UPI0006239821|nr:PREDICTED: decapping and exoribonuclease protein isoform X2 [Linepithema humile]
MMKFKINFEKFPDYSVPRLTIELMGHFSVDGDAKYQADLSQLKYYIPPPILDNVCYDLKRNSECSTRFKPDACERLDFIFQWITENFSRLEKPLSMQKERWLDVDFICRRGVLKKLLCSPYVRYEENMEEEEKDRKKWIICASKYRGTIYLRKFYTDEQEKITTGYKFEQYMLADDPSHEPDPSAPLNICEEFHCVFKAKFGDHSLLYGAEIDGILSQEPINDTLIDKNIKLVELKTCPMHYERGRFYPDKATNWWSQNYLVGIDKIICGLKDKSNTVRMIKEYSTNSLIPRSKICCNQRKCEMFCKIFLDNVKRIVTKDYNECIYKFHWNPRTKDIVNYTEEAPDNENYIFLKEFVKKVEECKNTYQ